MHNKSDEFIVAARKIILSIHCTDLKKDTTELNNQSNNIQKWEKA